jgi:hypothetical protein
VSLPYAISKGIRELRSFEDGTLRENVIVILEKSTRERNTGRITSTEGAAAVVGKLTGLLIAFYLPGGTPGIKIIERCSRSLF